MSSVGIRSTYPPPLSCLDVHIKSPPSANDKWKTRSMFVRRFIGFQRSWPLPQGVVSSLRHRSPPVSVQTRLLLVPFQARRNASTDEDAGADTVNAPDENEPMTDDSGQLGAQNGAQPVQVGQMSNGTSSDRLRTHQFDTHRLVSALQSAGYTQPQAIALMKCLRTVLVNGTEVAKSHYLSRGDLENVRLNFRLG